MAKTTTWFSLCVCLFLLSSAVSARSIDKVQRGELKSVEFYGGDFPLISPVEQKQ